MQPPTANDPTTPDGLTRVEATVEGAGAPMPAPPARRARKAAVIVVASVVGLAGVAAAASFVALRGSSETLTTKLPADTDVVVTAYLDPAASQKVNLFRLTSAFPSLGGESEVTGRAGDQVDAMLETTGLTHEDFDWVGSQVAVGVDVRTDGEPSVAIMLDTTDEAAAEVSLRALRDGPMFRGTTWTREDHGGVQVWAGDDGREHTYVGIVDGTVVVANDGGTFDGIVATANGDAPSLADDQDFVDTMAGLPEARLGMVYVAPGDLLSLLERMRGPGLSDLGTAAGVDPEAIRGIGVTLAAEPDALALDSEVAIDASKLTPEQLDAYSAEDHENVQLAMVPADALGFVGVQHLDSGLDAALAGLPSDQRAALDQSGLEPAISSLTGDLAFELSMPSGSVTPGGALMIGTDDEDAMAAALEIAAGAISPASMFVMSDMPTPVWKTVDHGGVTVTYLSGDGGGSGLAAAYAVFDGTGVLASSKDEAFRIIDTAHGAPSAMVAEAVTAALDDVAGSEDVLYLDLAGVIDAVADTGMMDPEWRGNLDPLRTLVAGTQTDPEHQHARLVLRIG
ncbi:MAG: DUF3352 domain-containing protein [Actinomycetota bacterium]